MRNFQTACRYTHTHTRDRMHTYIHKRGEVAGKRERSAWRVLRRKKSCQPGNGNVEIKRNVFASTMSGWKRPTISENERRAKRIEFGLYSQITLTWSSIMPTVIPEEPRTSEANTIMRNADDVVTPCD